MTLGCLMPRFLGALYLSYALALTLAFPKADHRAQAQGRMPVIGYVANYNAAASRLAILKQGLEDLGLREGTNIKMEYRTARLDREYFEVIAEFIALKVDLILAANAPATVAAAKSTKT